MHDHRAAGDARAVDEVEALGEVLPLVHVRRVGRVDAQVLQRLRATVLTVRNRNCTTVRVKVLL